jgi:UDP-N-acetylmuramoyl-L-alanyl-D-glutamate--2,6-diaminopimelate ligase
MLAGVPISARKKVTLLEDREAAIQDAIASSHKGDVVLIAGKGHETYQEVKGTRYPFDDREKILRIQSSVLT